MKKIFATIALIAIGSMAYTYAQNNNLQRPDDGGLEYKTGPRCSGSYGGFYCTLYDKGDSCSTYYNCWY